jgi:hypothetical protein
LKDLKWQAIAAFPKTPCGSYAENVEKIWVSRDLAEELLKQPWWNVYDQAVP